MNKLHSFLSAALLCLSMAATARAALVTGVVQCDANRSLTNDVGDAGIGGVMVVVTSLAGGFSNSTFTAADGSFSVQIPNFDSLAERRDPLSQVYFETLVVATLPPASIILFPPAITYLSPTPGFYIDFFSADSTNLVYTSGPGSSSTGNWLVSSPSCQSSACGLSGDGIIRVSLRRLEHSFGGRISPTALPDGTRRGHWSDVAHGAKLRFQSTIVQTVSCGGSTANVIEFSGLGTLRGIAGNKARYDQVHFTARAEDHGRQGRGVDRYYLRVWSSDGTTLLLVSGDASNPLVIVPVPISTGNLTIGASNNR